MPLIAPLIAGFVFAIGGTVLAIGKLAPELFLKINGGFILWAMTGNPMPPYFSPDAWNDSELDSWIQENDVVVSTGAKSGTNWTLYLAHLIRTYGDEEKFPFVDVNLSTIWPDLIQTPGETWADQKPRYSTIVLPDGTPLQKLWNNPEYPFRVFKSHFGPKEAGGVLPIKHLEKRKVKIIAMVRNGLDVVASIVPFFESTSEEFRQMWGGFPEKSSGDIAADAEKMLKDLLPGGILDHLYFKYVKEWWSFKEEPNVLLLHYADMKADLSASVAKISDFIGVQLTPTQHDIIIKKGSFSHMKAISNQFDIKLPLNSDLDCIMKSGAVIRKGQNGDGKIVFNAEQQARWKEAENKEFGDIPGLLKWARHGGAW